MTSPKRRSAIIYGNASHDIFVIDIPRSIEDAQQLRPPQWPRQGENKYECLPRLLSCPVMDAPYPGPSPEPKTEAARQRVLRQIPVSEQTFHESVVPVVSRALEHVREYGSGMHWCFPRYVASMDAYEQQQQQQTEDDGGTAAVAAAAAKNKPPEEAPSSCRKRKRPGNEEASWAAGETQSSIPTACSEPPIILAPGLNSFESISRIQGSVVQNPSEKPVVLQITSPSASTVAIPPKSSFVLAHLIPSVSTCTEIHTFNQPKFDLIVFDPPWPNRSLRRSGHYTPGTSYGALRSLIQDVIATHLKYPAEPTQHDSSKPSLNPGIVGIWTTNAAHARESVHTIFESCGLEAFEEWIWVKCTSAGEPVTPLDGIWRKPYEVILWGRRTSDAEAQGPAQTKRRVIFGVLDIHSRKPNLKELVERIFFTERTTSGCSNSSTEGDMSSQGHGVESVREYAALEVFARNLTAGWWACGDEVLRFNHERWWTNLPDE